MAMRNKTIRKLPKASRKLARLINEMESTLTRLKHFLPDVETLELATTALYNRLSTHEKKLFAQEQQVPDTNGPDPQTNEPLFDTMIPSNNTLAQEELQTKQDLLSDSNEPAA